jgi:hypothetical protein
MGYTFVGVFCRVSYPCKMLASSKEGVEDNCDKKLGRKTNITQIIYILNNKYILGVSHQHELETTQV